ncbi:hypothetical protein [Methylobacterium sp. WSM2598]|uniref:hypothetical protein n=1 Tax=Methylobacterium sp. WSM2598 TaxID=398261 RepID=UPI000364C320|nr:hypothetical protein [Methylobacterium sp. WSM2598]
MSAALAKLAYIHRRLWQRDGTYRAAFLLGPMPLLGAAVAAALWFGLAVAEAPAPARPAPPPWAEPHAGPLPSGPLRAEPPVAPLPAARAGGGYVGYETGWYGTLHKVEMSPSLEITVAPAPSGRFTVEDAQLDVGPILTASVAAAPANYLGTANALLAVQDPGSYGFAMRIERGAGPPADCLRRLIVAGQRLFSVVSVNLGEGTTRDVPPVALDMTPGLYRITAYFGCWRNGQPVGPARGVVLVRRPGDATPLPARPGEILRPILPPHRAE